MSLNKKFLSILISSLLIVYTPVMCFASSTSYIWSGIEDYTALVSNNITESYTDDSSNPLELDCGSAILIEQTTGQVLYSYNSHEQLRPASVTKIMSILLIMEAIEDGKIDYDTKIPCSENAASMGGSQIWLDTTETLTVDEMLKAICVVSANDCVVAMAEYIAGSEEAFVEMMNEKAQELGMNDTTFMNCHGIDEDGHVTSSYDIALMSMELLNKYPEITNYTTIWNATLRDGESELINTNKLVRNYDGCTGLKTGSTSLALYNLSASATRDGLSLIAVIMKAPTSDIRFSNTTTLLNYGFTNYEFTTLASANEVVQTVHVEKGTSSSINAVVESDVGTLLSKGNDINIDKTISLSESISAPVNVGDVIGTVTFTLNGETVGSCNLIADSSVDKINILSMSKEVFYNWFNLLR